MHFHRLPLCKSLLSRPSSLVNTGLALVAAFGIGFEAAKAAPVSAPPPIVNGDGGVDETGLAPRIRGRKKLPGEIVLPRHRLTQELLPLTGKIIVTSVAATGSKPNCRRQVKSWLALRSWRRAPAHQAIS